MYVIKFDQARVSYHTEERRSVEGKSFKLGPNDFALSCVVPVFNGAHTYYDTALTLRIITILGHLDKPNYHLVQSRDQPSINRFKMTSSKTNEDLIETNRPGSLQMILMLGTTPLCNTSIVNRGSLVQSLNHATPSGIQCSLQKTRIGVGRVNLLGFTIDKGCKVPAR